MEIVLAVVAVVAVLGFVAGFAYDISQDFNNTLAKRVGLVSWIVFFVALFGLLLNDEGSREEEKNVVTIECVIGENETLTCEVVE